MLKTKPSAAAAKKAAIAAGASNSKSGKNSKGGKGQPTLDEFLAKRDFTGALTLLEFQLKCRDGDAKAC